MATYTVIISTHQRPDWLKRAIRSVKAQSHPDVDVIVVADAPCAASYRDALPLLGPGDLFLQRGGAPGPAESRNLGIRLLTSDHALFLDDDDELSEHFIADIDAKRPHDFRGVLYADFSILMHRSADASQTMTKHSLAGTMAHSAYVRNFIPNSCLVYPTRILKKFSFDAGLILNEDWDFILNVMTAASFAYCPAEGPIIHKTEAPRRGNSNGDQLLHTYMSIYRKWPAPTAELKLARKTLLGGQGVDWPLSKL